MNQLNTSGMTRSHLDSTVPFDADSDPFTVDLPPAQGTAFGDRLLAAVDSGAVRGPIVAGCLEIIGLEQIRESLGPRWPLVATRARDVAEEEIRKGLEGADFYESRPDGSFLIYFGCADRMEADRQRREISDAIEARLLDGMPAEARNLRVDAFVAEVTQDFASGGGSPGDALFASLRRMKAESEQRLRQYEEQLVRSVRVLFQPVRNIASREITANRCLLDPFSGENALRQLHSMCDSRAMARIMAQIDTLILSKALAALHEALMASRRTLLLVPVQWHTLANPRTRETFLEVFEHIPELHLKHLGLEILAIPREEFGGSLVRLRRVLSGIGGRLFVRHFPLDQQAAAALASTVEGVAVHAGMLDQEDPARLRAMLRSFATVARTANLRTLACGAATLAHVEAISEAGFDYLCGSAVHYTVDHLRSGDGPTSAASFY